MSDSIDQAQMNQLNQVRIQPRDYNKPSLTECEECSNDIPIQRQRYGAVTLCIECKNKQEQHTKRYL